MNLSRRKRLGDLLIESGKITQDQLEDVLRRQGPTGKRLGELLIEEGLITEEDILDVLRIQLDVPKINLEAVEVEETAVKAIPESLASKYTLIPVSIKDNHIKIVMNDPLNIFAIDDVKIASGCEVDVSIATKEDIRKAIDKYYSGQFAKKAAEELTKESAAENEDNDEGDAFDDIKNAPVVRLVDTVVRNAVKLRASDIHIEPFDKYIRIRYRIDGELQEILTTPKETLGALVTRIKILANLNIAEKRLPQDGRILTKVDERDIDLRVSILPTVNGEKVVIRILGRDSFLISKERLGMFPEDLDKLDRIIKSPYGIILVTGPTGSGKSTTLYTVLNDLNTIEKNIITVEDPVEYMMEGINQVNVNQKAGLSFAAGLRSILRQDPDIIMIGEIRDGETAEIAIRAAITGHLVLSTIHTNDAPSAIVRLVDMGIEPYLVATSITGVIAQRLVKKICPNCKEKYIASDYEKKLLGIPQNERVELYRGTGCPVCGNTGYSGRIGTYEIMEISREHREFMMRNRSTDEIRDLSLSKGMKTLKMSCRDMVLKGITTMDELVKIAYLKE